MFKLSCSDHCFGPFFLSKREEESFAAEYPWLSVIFDFYHRNFILQVQRIAMFSLTDFRKVWAS